MSSLKYDIGSFKKLIAIGIPCAVEPHNELSARLADLVETGYEYVYFGDELFTHVRSGGKVAAIKNAVEGSGLKVHSAHFGYLYPGPGDTLQGMMSNHLRDLDTAAEMGLRCVTTHYLSITGMGHPGFLSPSTLSAFAQNWVAGVEAVYEEAFEKFGGKAVFLERNNDLYRWLCDEAACRNLTVTIETATCHLTKTPLQIISHIRKIGRPNLGICLDSGHSHIMMGDVAAAVREAGSYLTETHFHDNFGDFDLHRPVGIGTIDWTEVIFALREIGYPGPITFEAGQQVNSTYKEEIGLYAKNWAAFLNSAAYLESKRTLLAANIDAGARNEREINTECIENRQ